MARFFVASVLAGFFLILAPAALADSNDSCQAEDAKDPDREAWKAFVRGEDGPLRRPVGETGGMPDPIG